MTKPKSVVVPTMPMAMAMMVVTPGGATFAACFPQPVT